MAKLGFADYAIISLALGVSAMTGVYFKFTGGRQKTLLEYLMADRQMSAFPVSFSTMASFISTVTLMGLPTEIYMYGTQLAIYVLITPVAGIICAYMYIPVYYEMKVTTVFEYIEKRFGKSLRVITSILYTIQEVFFLGLCFYGPCAALSAVTDLSTFGSVTILASVCAFYCFMGGIKAVMWTDVFQALLMFVVALSLSIGGTIYCGGIKQTLNLAKMGGRLEFFNLSFDTETRYTLWGTVLWSAIFIITYNGASQTDIQRLLSVRSLKEAKCATIASTVLMSIIVAICCYNGVVLYSMYHNCDPILKPQNNTLSSLNQMVPHAIVTLFSDISGLSGLCIAGIFSASLSSVSSTVNSLTTVTIEDYIRPYFSHIKFVNLHMSLIAKIIAVGYGIICLLLSHLVGRFRGLFEATVILCSSISGPILGVFTLGIFTTAANEKGAFIGLLVGLIFSLWSGFGIFLSDIEAPHLPRSIEGCDGNLITNTTATARETIIYSNYLERNRDIFPLYRISFTWFVVFNFVIALVVGYICSFIIGYFQKHTKPVLPEYISPVLRKWYFPLTQEKKYIKEKTETIGFVQHQEIEECNESRNK